MKIAQIIKGYDPIVGGYGRHVSLISEELRKRGHKVDILSTKYSPGSGGGAKRFWNTPFLKITPGLFFYLLKNDYDIVHVHGYPTFQPWITCLAKKIKKFPLVFTPHFHPFGNKPKLIRKVFDALFGIPSLNNCDVIIALTEYEKQLLRKYTKNKIEIIPNPVKPVKKIKGFKKKYGIKNDFILFVGRIEKEKGINYLIDAIDDIDIVIIGRGSMKIKKKKNVHYVGEVPDDDLERAYNECLLLALPSKYEAFGLVLIEAMAHGKPVVATNAGPVPSIINGAGITVPFGNVKKLREAILKIINNPNKYKKCAIKRAKEFNVKNVVDKLERVYNKL